MSSAICFNLDQSKILLSGNGLRMTFVWCSKIFSVPTKTQHGKMNACKVNMLQMYLLFFYDPVLPVCKPDDEVF